MEGKIFKNKAYKGRNGSWAGLRIETNNLGNWEVSVHIYNTKPQQPRIDHTEVFDKDFPWRDKSKAAWECFNGWDRIIRDMGATEVEIPA